MTWSDRVERIATCMAELERIYADYKAAPEQAMAIAVGEMDQLSELHRLIWEWDLYGGDWNSAGGAPPLYGKNVL